MKKRIALVIAIFMLYSCMGTLLSEVISRRMVPQAAGQLYDSHARQTYEDMVRIRTDAYGYGWLIVLVLSVFILVNPIKRIMMKFKTVAAVLLALNLTGCGFFMKPWEPIQLEVVQPNEEGFLLPYTGNAKEHQSSTNSEEYLKENIVQTQQVRIPQQWVASGYQFLYYQGDWKPAATLIKVDKSPVTREWTADTATGTSEKNEAVWVMSADQVEFSTGWGVTARIQSRDDAVKFLHNYRNATLSQVLDTEVRAKIQTEFALEVTDLPMDQLRKQATPHIEKVKKTVTDFFAKRGISITNIGITGGFIYKNSTIMDKLVEVFNAEQAKNISIAKTQAQMEENKRIQLEADSKAKALLTQKEAEATGIKSVADAKAYEIEKAKQDGEAYLALKRLEIEKAKIEKWDGAFPSYFMGGGGATPDLLLNLPVAQPAVKKPAAQ